MNDNEPLKVEFDVHILTTRRGRKRIVEGTKPPAPPSEPRIPRVARLMALAIRFDHLIRIGEITDYAEIASIGQITQGRVTQVMNMLHLAPDIQEAILHLPAVERGKDPITERELRSIAAIIDWRKQRRAWAASVQFTPP